MFLNMLPAAVAEKLRERKDLSTLQQYINEIDTDLGRLNDTKLAKIHAQRMSSALKSGSRSSINVVVDELPTSPMPAQSSNDDIGKKLDTLISVLSARSGSEPRGRTQDRTNSRDKSPRRNGERSKSPRGLDPAWEKEGKGCLHCALKGHNRKNCHKFKKLLAENDDKLPAGYKGAYEKWKELRGKTKVSAIANLDDKLEEFEETDLIWCLPTKSCLKTLPMPIAPLNNCFDALADEVEQDDEDEVMIALQQLTSNIRVGPKVPQKQQKKLVNLSKKEIASIAKQVSDGTIDLPSLDLESNKDYEAIWALIDSGAGKSCANKSKHFPSVKTRNSPSTARMATANGHELKSRGTFTVEGKTSEGQDVTPMFEDADVDMPIIAVSDLSRENTEIVFRQKDSELVDVPTGRKSRFAKQRGVYFMKMYYKKNQCIDNCECEHPDFIRPGAL